jgi:hypothetical protein
VFSVFDGILAGELYSPALDTTINKIFLEMEYVENTVEPLDSVVRFSYKISAHVKLMI